MLKLSPLIMNMKNVFLEKTVLITGGSSGIGLALAKILAKHGANLVLLARRADRLDSAEKEIRTFSNATSGLIEKIIADVANEDEVKTGIGKFVSDHGVPDYLINSAGVSRPGMFEETSADVFRWMMNVNFLGTVYATQAVIPGMIARNSGYIVNISSMAGFLGVVGYTAYGASKFAVRGFSDTLRAEMKLHNINVSVVFPPDTDTPQLAEEEPYKPAVTKALSTGNTSLRSADEVADSILKGVARKQYIITPGMDNTLLYRANSLLGNLSYWVMDQLVKQAKHQAEKQ